MKFVFFIVLFSTAATCSFGQEYLTHLKENKALFNTPKNKTNTHKTTSLTLPFFEDFTDESPYPNPARWTDQNVYINNTMCYNPVSRGVATFDALNSIGRPYDTTAPNIALYADSLTSQYIDLSGRSIADSIYLSFFYQPQGYGFSPEPGDSLMLFFKKGNNVWEKIWAMAGNLNQAFQVAMIPIIDTAFYHNNFQFRFINIASINSNDDVWNLDYIKINTNRTINDTLINDLAMTTDPPSILNDYYEMPYRQFIANYNAEIVNTHTASMQNNYATTHLLTYNYNAVETTTNTTLYANSASNNVNLPPVLPSTVSFLMYNNFPPLVSWYGKMTINNTYFLINTPTTESKINDTIVHHQIFDNYLAYDDGTAEKSYFLNLFPTLPGKTAVEFHLNIPDTLRAIGIYFGQQVPTAINKIFNIVIYKTIAGVGGATTDQILRQQTLLTTKFTDTINHYTYYNLDTALALPAGVFFVGTVQPTQLESDSLYFGWDANRTNGNHLYYNVLNSWQPSGLTGALMIRPILGQPITPTTINSPAILSQNTFNLYPNPTFKTIYLNSLTHPINYNKYKIYNNLGQLIIDNSLDPKMEINVETLPSGIYFLQLGTNEYWSPVKSFTKQ